MIPENVIAYLLKLHGWCPAEKMQKLYSLIKQCSEEFPNTQLLSVELGVFSGRSLFPIAMAHKELKNGFAIGIDAWTAAPALEGTNSKENNDWWSKLNYDEIFTTFRVSTIAPTWSGYVEYLRGRTDEFMDKFQDDSITLLHQDSNHASEVIIRELELWSPKMKIGGYWVIDDIDWESTKAGYAKLPEYGFELVQEYKTWAVYKKTEVKKPGISLEDVSEIYTDGKDKTESFTYDEKIMMFSIVGNTNYANSNSGIKIGEENVRSVLLYLPDTPEWIERHNHCMLHLAENKIHPYRVAGVHAKEWGITGTKKFMRDAWTRIRAKYSELPYVMPEELKEQYYMGDGKVGGCISHYILYSVMSALPDKYFLVMEDDCRFVEGWRDKLNQALIDVPDDFDFLFVGSSDAENKEPVPINGDVYRFPNRPNKADYYPQTGYCYIVAKKALPVLLATQRSVSDPVDISLIYEAFPYLNVYAILPRIATQGSKTELNP